MSDEPTERENSESFVVIDRPELNPTNSNDFEMEPPLSQIESQAAQTQMQSQKSQQSQSNNNNQNTWEIKECQAVWQFQLSVAPNLCEYGGGANFKLGCPTLILRLPNNRITDDLKKQITKSIENVIVRNERIRGIFCFALFCVCVCVLLGKKKETSCCTHSFCVCFCFANSREKKKFCFCQ